MPARARSLAARRPATPAPTTTARDVVSTRIGSSGRNCDALATAAATRDAAFSVAVAGSSLAQLTCSRMLACSSRYGLRPPRSSTFLKVVSCSFGEQAATTTLSSPSFLTSSRTAFCPGSEHMKTLVLATTTPGSLPAASITFSTSTTSEMLPPQ